MRRTIAVVGAVLGLIALASGCSGRTTGGPGGGAGEAPSAGGQSVGGTVSAAGSGSKGGGTASGGVVGAAGSTTGGVASGGGGATAPGALRDFLGDPDFPDDFWRPADAGESQVDPAPLEQALKLIETSGWEIHSFLIAKNGRLAFERYGWSTGKNPAHPNKTAHQVLPDERQLQFSTTKSFLSALVGIALDEGAFKDLQVRAADYFPDYAMLNPSAEKSSITLEDLLTMRSGLQFVEGDESTFRTADPARAVLARPVVDTPVGTVWNYSSGGANIVAEMLRVATGKTPLEYGKAKLFGPIGIESPPWDAAESGTSFGGFGLSLTTREMARFGELLRNSGKWKGQAVLPSTWADESVMPRSVSPWGGQYGYFWWIPTLPGFFNALGSFGQMIYVSRNRGLVVVFTAYMDNQVAKTNLERLIRDYVLPATD